MIHEKLRNYDVAKKRLRGDVATSPSDVSVLPPFREPQSSGKPSDDPPQNGDSEPDDDDEAKLWPRAS